MEFKDYYAVLGVKAEASADEIKKAYKRLARRYHPDVSKEADAERKFKELGEAYEVLRDSEKRAEYDQLRRFGARGRDNQFTPPPGWQGAGASGGHMGDDTDFSDFFEAFFGHRGGAQQGGARHGFGESLRVRGEDVQAELSLLLEEAYNGSEQILQLRVPEADAQGLLRYRQRKLKVKVPAGTTDGAVLRMKGQGGPGIGGAPAGDLLVTIRLAPHPVYTVDGKDLSLVVPVLPWEAALGAKVVVPSLKGRTRVSVPAGSQSGQRLRLAGQGLPGNPPGDYYVVLKVVMPERNSEQDLALYRQLAGNHETSGAADPRHWEGL
ncbi:MAG TPA: DnaJ C-terminal domain-containing protein [Hyphomicrobiales bacterium]|nr:DnaJ C-terminal domain-containing protein [Hyphomicrobiales bacterium]